VRPPDIEPGTAILAAARKHRAIKGLGRLDFDPSLHHGRPFSSAGFRPDDQSLRAEVEVWYERTWLPRSSWKNWSARLLTTHGFADSIGTKPTPIHPKSTGCWVSNACRRNSSARM